MSDFKHSDIPLLEYDTDTASVISPFGRVPGLRLPERAVFAFLGDLIDRYAEANGLEVIAEFESITKMYPIYIAKIGDKEVCLCQAPMGAPAATQILDWLIGHGVKCVISAGGCGVLTDMPENVFLVPTKALRDEGTSFHYLPPSRYIALDEKMQDKIISVFSSKGIPVQKCVTWTTDGFYRETRAKVKSRKAEGCSVVEMECSALAACAKFRGADFGMFLFTADSLANVDLHDNRNWGKDSLGPALEICMDMIAQI